MKKLGIKDYQNLLDLFQMSLDSGTATRSKLIIYHKGKDSIEVK